MKTIFMFMLVVLSTIFHAQDYNYYNGLYVVSNKINTEEDKNFVGSPYYNPKYISSKIGDTQNYLPIRYNAFLDKVEILNGKDVYELPKSKEFSKLTFKTNGEILLYINDGILYGYFIELVNGNSQLLKKIKISYQKEVVSNNGLLKGLPARYEIEKPIYFIKNGDNIIKLTKKSDELINALPADKKDVIKDFVKTNKIKLTEESDLIKLVNFLNK